MGTCTCGRPGCSLHPLNVHYPPRVSYWGDETATLEEQEVLKSAHQSGVSIEAKGRDSVDCGYDWGVVQNPRWDFCNNYYRVAPSE